jgi:hypothetical protein
MDEEEWLTTANPTAMYDFVLRQVSPRKLRLFGCACWCSQWDRPLDHQGRTAYALAESAFCGREIDWQAVLQVGQRAYWKAAELTSAHNLLVDRLREHDFVEAVTDPRAYLSDIYTRHYLWPHFNPHDPDALDPTEPDRIAHAHLARDVFGNPFRCVRVDPSWLSPNVREMSTHIYEANDFGVMPMLADALQEAGCDHDDILNHCREGGPHVRGCWVIDELLGRQ